ncbi:hypothetical protein Nepgr_032543 [Nepenthes gracilis]|uniref:Uncharacterized protein n=1 Tax=Nepenthes gracilis TaxID=150966 RepID=A0AAD3TJG1_NEPGR|nr:hypothetical protein Nepgr_032543 [Nepenthes gracilis]
MVEIPSVQDCIISAIMIENPHLGDNFLDSLPCGLLVHPPTSQARSTSCPQYTNLCLLKHQRNLLQAQHKESQKEGRFRLLRPKNELGRGLDVCRLPTHKLQEAGFMPKMREVLGQKISSRGGKRVTGFAPGQAAVYTIMQAEWNASGANFLGTVAEQLNRRREGRRGES